jgi:hypothetical protein
MKEGEGKKEIDR